MNAEDVPEQVVYAALAAYLGRPGGILLAEDFGVIGKDITSASDIVDGAFDQMRRALAVALAHPDAQNARAQAAYSRGVEEGQQRQAATDERAAYQRAHTAGRAAVASEPVESVLDTVVDEEALTMTLAVLRAQKRHAEVAAEAVLEQTDLARRAFESVQDGTRAEAADRERRWEAAQAADTEKLTAAYVIRRDAIYAAISHAGVMVEALTAMSRSERASVAAREQIMDAVPWWAAQLTPITDPPPPVPVGTESAHAVVFADQLIGALGGFETVDSVHDSTTPGAFRVILTDDTVIDVVVSEDPDA